MTDICKGENYKYTLVIEGKEHVLELYDIAILLGIRGGPLEHALKKMARSGETHKEQVQDLKESIDCINIAMSNPEYLKRGEKRFVLSEAPERKTVIGELHVDVTTNLNRFIPEGATHFKVNYHGVTCYYKLDGLIVYEWLAGEDNPFWLKLEEDEVLKGMFEGKYRNISELTGDSND